jgi:hypothetical protein
MTRSDKLTILGWREWLALPELGLPYIKAKIDTGARTSALHAFSVEAFMADGVRRVRFGIHPLQKRTDVERFCEAEVADERWVTDSGGHKEKRLVIVTPVKMGDRLWPIEMTLTNRDTMGFRMLLGRTAMQGRFLVNPEISFVLGRPPSSAFP